MLLLSATTLAAAAYWIGLEVENLARQAQPGWQITQLERGWFSSAADSRVSMNAPALELQEVALQHQIYHGPLPLLQWPKPALTVIDTRINPQILQQQQLFELSPQQEPFTMVSRLAFDQTMQHELTITPLRLKNRWGDVDHLAMDGLDASLQLSALGQFNNADLSIHQLQMSSQREGFAFSLEQLQLNLAQDQALAGHYRLDLNTTLDSLTLQQQTAQTGRLRLSIIQLNQSALLQLLQSGADTQLLALQQLLQFKPRLILDELFLQTARGQLSAQADLVLKEFNLLQLFAPAGLLGALLQQADAEIHIAKPLLESFLAAQQIHSWQNAGFIKLTDDTYHCRIRLYNKKLQLNDVELNLP